jgi:K+-sensing histidine kinase KdpD
VERLDPPEHGCTRRIIVEDNGIGISRSSCRRSSSLSRRSTGPEAKNVSGTGLGLAIVKRIVDLMGGRISVQSKLHCGTRFTVELPILPAERAGESSRKGLNPSPLWPAKRCCSARTTTSTLRSSRSC